MSCEIGYKTSRAWAFISTYLFRHLPKMRMLYRLTHKSFEGFCLLAFHAQKFVLASLVLSTGEGWSVAVSRNSYLFDPFSAAELVRLKRRERSLFGDWSETQLIRVFKTREVTGGSGGKCSELSWFSIEIAISHGVVVTIVVTISCLPAVFGTAIEVSQ